MLWLQAYTAEYAGLAQADSAVAARVSDSVATAARTYIEPGAPYEINLTDGTRSELLALPASPPPPPSAYEAARKEVQWFLEDSLARWEKRVMPNAGWRRLAFSTYVGLFNALLTVAAMVIARLYIRGRTGRIVAACLTPWLWCGIVGVVCGLKGVRVHRAAETSCRLTHPPGVPPLLQCRRHGSPGVFIRTRTPPRPVRAKCTFCIVGVSCPTLFPRTGKKERDVRSVLAAQRARR